MKDEEKKQREEEPKQERVTMITTSNLQAKKKRESNILTTHDLPDVLPFQKDEEESSLKTMITTKGIKEGKK